MLTNKEISGILVQSIDKKNDSMRMFSRLSLLIFLCLIFAVSCTATSNCTGGDNCGNRKSQQKVLSPANKMQTTDNDIPKAKQKFKAQEVLVKFKPGTSKEAIDNMAKQYNLEIIKVVSKRLLYLFKIAGQESVPEVVAKLSKLDIVEYAQPNFTYEIM
jgi:hypothetical protein